MPRKVANIYNSCNINKGMYIDGIPLIDKHWTMITYSGIGSYGCKYIILMKTHLKRNMTGLFLLPPLPELKTDTNHLLQGHHSSSSLSNSVNSTTACMNVQSIH